MLIGSAAIAIWNDIVPESRNGFFEWHPREHMQERLGIPGFKRGRRYIALDADIEFLTLYEADDISVFSSEAYQKRLNIPTPWSLEVLPGFRNNLRGVCEVAHSEGHADGGLMMALRFRPEEGSEARTRQLLSLDILPSILSNQRMCGTHLLICDKEKSVTKSTLQRGRTITSPDWIALVEGISRQQLEDISSTMSTVLKDTAQIENAGIYQMEYCVSRLTVEEDTSWDEKSERETTPAPRGA